MDLKPTKYKTIYSVMASLFIAAVFLLAGLIIGKKLDAQFRQIQEEATIQNITAIEGIFNRELESLSILVTDWAMWDDMYDFAGEPNEEFIESEFQDTTFSDIDIDVVIIKNEKKDIIFSRQFNVPEADEKNIPGSILQAASEMCPTNGLDHKKELKKTIVDLGSKKVLLALQHISKSNGEGEERGAVVFGRYIDREFIKEFESIPGFYFNVFPENSDYARTLFGSVDEENQLAVQMENRRKVTGIKYLKELSTVHPLILLVDHTPTVYLKLIDVVIFITLVMGLAYLAVIFAVFVLFNRVCPASKKCDSPANKKTEL